MLKTVVSRMNREFMLRYLLSGVMLILSFEGIAQQAEFDIRGRSMYIPARQKPWKFDHSLSLAQIYLPSEWLEQSISAPMLEYKANFSLPKGFTLNANLRTLIIANDVRFGPSWQYSPTDRIHVALAYQLGFGYGFLHEFGYNNTIQVWQHHPMLRAGYSFKNVAITLQGRMDWIMDTKLNVNDYVTSNTTGSTFNGYAVGMFLEQRLTRRNSISFGFVANFSKFNILGWPALNVVDRQYFIPEVNIGFRL